MAAVPVPESPTEGRPYAGGLRLLLLNPTIADKREHVHIGLATIGTYVRVNGPHEVRILDFMTTRRIWKRRLAEVLAEYRPDLVAMYMCTPYFAAARQIAREIKRLQPALPVLAGGHHPTLAPEEVMAEPDFDLAIVGEGEKPMLKLLDAMAAGAPLAQVPGLCFREGGVVRQVPKDTLIEAGRIPAVDWSLHDDETLRDNFYFFGILPLMGSRGCPARCSMCSITNVQRLYPGERFLRFRDPVKVVDEVEQNLERWLAHGVRILFIYDLNLLVNVKWLRAFTDEYRRRGLNRKLKWSAYTRGDHVTPEALDCLRDSGCVNLRLGIEAAHPFMRNAVYNKDLPQDVMVDAIRDIKALGISVTGYIIAGGPGERPEWLIESLEFAKRHGVDNPVFFLFKMLAKADILAKAEGLGSELLTDGHESTGDFLHGVDLRNRFVKPWQVKAFLLLSHVLFGPGILWWQARRSGWRYLPRLVRYVVRGMGRGFSFYGALTYFIFYGDDHVSDPYLRPPCPNPGWGWRLMMAFARLWLGHSGQPEPEAVPTVGLGAAMMADVDDAGSPGPARNG